MFAVLLRSPEDADLEKTAQVLAKHNSAPIIDMRRPAKHAWGILGAGLSEQEAVRLKNTAAAQGLETLVVQEEALAAPAPVNMRAARCAPEGLVFTLSHGGAEETLPWNQVSVLSAVGLTEEFSVTTVTREKGKMNMALLLSTGIPLRAQGKEIAKTTKTSEFFMYLDLWTAGARFHLNAQKFNFGALGARCQPHVMGNFRVFLTDLAQALPATLKNKGARMILQSRPFSAMGYETYDDYEREGRWLWALSRAR